MRRTPGPAVGPFREGLVCGFTPLHIHTFFHAELQQILPDRRVEIYKGLYGDRR